MIGDTDLDDRPSSTACCRPAVAGDAAKRTAADNQTVRNVFVIGPDKKIKLILVYPMTTGRNFDEVLRVIDSLQLTAKHKVATPVNWKQGEDVIIAGSVSDEDAKKQYPQGWKAPKPYIRIVPQPGRERVPRSGDGRCSSTAGRAAAADLELGRYLAAECMTCHRAARGERRDPEHLRDGAQRASREIAARPTATADCPTR